MGIEIDILIATESKVINSRRSVGNLASHSSSKNIGELIFSLAPFAFPK